MRGWLGLLILLVLAAISYLLVRDYARRHPENLPWTELDLAHPLGRFTGVKLVSLADEPARCRALLRDAALDHVPVPPRRLSRQCGYHDGVRLAGGRLRYAPPGLVTSCPVAAALHLLQRDVVQRAALRHFNSPVAVIEHAGSYSCRRLYGRSEGPFSEHATADAVDITGFRLADGTRIGVLRDWDGAGPKAAFLRDVRDGACRLFSTVLSPDYNAAHRDHLHLDQADRGAMGIRVCR